MKKYFFIAALLFTQQLVAQNNYSITYKQPHEPFNIMCRLVFNDSLAACYYHHEMNDLYKKAKAFGTEYLSHGTFYDWNTKKAYLQVKWLRRKKHIIAVPLESYNWILTTDTKVVKDYNCNGAYAIIAPGDTAFAFYTTDIVSPYGPFRFLGLPGTVLEAYGTLTGEHWVADKIEKTDATIVMPEYTKIIPSEPYKRDIRH